MIKEVFASIFFALFLIGLFGATALIEPVNQVIMEAK